MGNSISREEQIAKENCITKITNYDCPILDVGERRGHTDYIDFIRENEIDKGWSVVKGFDMGFRFFIVIRSEFVYSDGRKERTFSTFFQRYNDSKTLWHCCGHDGVTLMNTEGGMNIEQFELICQLLYQGKIILDSENIHHTYLNCFPNGLAKSHETSSYPIALQLGYSE